VSASPRAAEPPSGSAELGAALAGLCGTLVGIGLARFAYAPLLPALIESGWFAPAEAAYIGAANLVGYLAGALSTGRLLQRVRATPLARGMMVLVAVTFAACAWNLGFVWFIFWRFLSGFAGGVLMVASAPAILARVAAGRRGRVVGIVFTGVGIGIVAAGTLLPFLLRLGLVTTWLALAAAAALLTAAAWRSWPADPPRAASAPRAARTGRFGWPVLAVGLLYALGAFGLVPHMVFLVDFVARGLGHGIATGSLFWVIYGLGAIAGPFIVGSLGDQIGFARALPVGLALQMGAILIPLTAPSPAPLAVSALIMGAFTPGMPSLVLGRLHELTDGQSQAAAWRLATVAFALAQAGGAYAMSWLYARSDGYDPLFLAAAVALTAALTLSLATVRTR
jgi:predicted MFS family arabinose efflux permease